MRRRPATSERCKMQPMAKRHQPGEAIGRPDAVVTAQWVGLKVAGFALVILTGAVIGGPVVTHLKRLSLDLARIGQPAARAP